MFVLQGDSIYANKKTDVNQKATVVGGEAKSDKSVQPVKVDPSEVADNDLKTGVGVTVVIVIVTVLAIVAAICISVRTLVPVCKYKINHTCGVLNVR